VKQAASLNRARQYSRTQFCTILVFVAKFGVFSYYTLQNLMSYSCSTTPISYKGSEISRV